MFVWLSWGQVSEPCRLAGFQCGSLYDLHWYTILRERWLRITSTQLICDTYYPRGIPVGQQGWLEGHLSQT
jgi:hypothetical protein